MVAIGSAVLRTAKVELATFPLGRSSAAWGDVEGGGAICRKSPTGTVIQAGVAIDASDQSYVLGSAYRLQTILR